MLRNSIWPCKGGGKKGKKLSKRRVGMLMMLMPTPTITTLPSLPHLHRKMRDSRRVCKLPERRLEKLVVLVALDIARAARPNRLEVILRAPVPGRRKGKKGKEEKRMAPEQTCILQAQRRRSKARPLHRMRLSAKLHSISLSLCLSLSLTTPFPTASSSHPPAPCPFLHP